MAQSGDLTVGEVLSLLQEDFPEATLGRLREFEDLTLIAPELGPSGHRRYPAETLDRLRWVLAKMREGFDPADLVGEQGGAGQPTPAGEPAADPRPSGSAAVVRKRTGSESSQGSVAEPTLFDSSEPPAGEVDDQTAVQPLPSLSGGRPVADRQRPTTSDRADSSGPAGRDTAKRPTSSGEPTAAHQVVDPQAEAPQRPVRRQPEPPAERAPAPKARRSAPEPATAAPPPERAPSAPAQARSPKDGATSQPERPKVTPAPQPETPKPTPSPAPAQNQQPESPPRDLHAERKARIEAVSTLQEPPSSEPPPRPRPSRTRDLPSATAATELLTRTDFLGEVDIDETTLGEMERFGVISPVTIGGTSSYDQSAVSIGHIVANLLKLGFEARHLRMFRMASEREVDLLRQMALPLLKQRNPVGREQARERLQQAADLGGQLHSALVAEGIAELVDHSGADTSGG